MSSPLVSVDPEKLAAQREFNEMLRQLPTPDVSTPEGIVALRQLTSDASHSAPTVLDPEDLMIDGGDGQLRMRVWSPDGPSAAVMLRIHGGGWIAGLPEDDDALNDRLARAAGITIVSPEYRLQPEVQIDQQIADCVSAANWLANEAQDRFGAQTLLLSGISAGAHLAAATTLALRSASPSVFDRIAGLWLDCGAYDLSESPSVVTAPEDGLVLPRAFVHGLLSSFLKGSSTEARRNPAISPLYADLAGLPPTLATVGALDPLVDDSVFFVGRMNIAGVDASVHVWPECAHAFTNMGTPLADEVLERVAAWVAALL